MERLGVEDIQALLNHSTPQTAKASYESALQLPEEDRIYALFVAAVHYCGSGFFRMASDALDELLRQAPPLRDVSDTRAWELAAMMLRVFTLFNQGIDHKTVKFIWHVLMQLNSVEGSKLAQQQFLDGFARYVERRLFDRR